MKVPLLLLVVLLSGCAITRELAEDAAGVADKARESAEFVLCRGITVGAWVRAYGDSANKANAWRELCSVSVRQLPVQP